ncbi:ketopantoate reductase family protein [Tuwongella immobilis]|uniref:2-dehydropantoate 2-reductase n=1 Tax=Tuwongella immobilis TaxID=692036 RepID=A0A6C2YU54_9BACT|nr:ketopantoate reductase family protein [Tuwongella immobilis]VIP04435.1 2-dehydropantoate 2-reductase : Ketopantoate reductase ApbA/PanE domain protein OS=Nitrosomonas sp. (strain Is79A3) GN=Nit79A3_0073 PE=4 SV=1: ApbA: ApbA_C [Tuwongella immobilis]VTS06232.1 2-dehydropantoate 2-reductase : Ketopantoate reductase ApbA/PanE domain protein OS=Nitrosomonas sp. (strain Is79A3) GN=Nit79A3_0073 PE=4 SV=1: ApbA: ApbA_C [Tuwongella immobilis]
MSLAPIRIVGAGGIGCTVAAILAQVGTPVELVEANPEKVAWGQRHGVEIVGRSAIRIPIHTFDDWQPRPNDRIILTTKCYDNAAVLNRIGDTPVELLPIQNGFDPILDAQPHAYEGIASFVSECDPDRLVTRITRPGELHLGPRRGTAAASELVQTVVRAFSPEKSLRIVTVSEILPYKYSKLMYNAAIAPLAAAAGMDNGELLTVPTARRLFFALLQENYRILANAGLRLERIGPFHPKTVARILRQRWLARMMAGLFAPSLRGTYCSMANDLPRGKTEMPYYNEHLIRLADTTPCPLNRGVVSLLDRIQRERLPVGRHHLESLLPLLG